MYLSEVYGYVADARDGYLHIEPPGGAEIVTVYAADASVYDLLTGLPTYPEVISAGMAVRASYDPGGYALAVWLNCGEAGAAAFKAQVSENIYYGEDACVFLTGDGKYRVTLDASTPVIDPYAGYVRPCDVRPGQEMFVWVDMVTASRPAQVFPEKVVLAY